MFNFIIQLSLEILFLTYNNICSILYYIIPPLDDSSSKILWLKLTKKLLPPSRWISLKSKQVRIYYIVLLDSHNSANLIRFIRPFFPS